MEDKFKLLLYAQHHRGIDRSNCHGHRTSNGYVVSWNEYEGILFGLTSLYEMVRWDAVEASDIYDDWIARKSIMIRDQVNPANVAASKWYSAKEIEWLVISRFGDERAKLLANKRLAEHEKSTVERLVEGWKSYGFILNQLSANARAELQGSGLHVDTDYDETD